MKPCSGNRKPIALLAVGALEAPAARDLRAHFQVCEGCRQYHDEIAHVTAALSASAMLPAMEGSEALHGRVVNAITAEGSPPLSEGVAGLLRGRLLNWRVALPVLAALVLGIVLVSHFQRPGPDPLPGRLVTAPGPATNKVGELEPSIRNYQIAADRSFEQLDELLSIHARRNPAYAPVYAASSFARALEND
jgi:hypothetical protein